MSLDVMRLHDLHGLSFTPWSWITYPITARDGSMEPA